MFIYLFKDNGACFIREVLRTDDDTESVAALHGLNFALSEVTYTPDDMYLDGGAIILKAPRPSLFHQFDYTTKQWSDPRTLQDHIAATRAARNALLLACDWTQLPDAPETMKSTWMAYRQALRDVTDQPDQKNIVWPAKPV